MGMYTKLHANIPIKNDECIAVIKYMLGKEITKPELPNHELFNTDRWEMMLKSCSYYFTRTNNSRLYYDEMTKEYVLHCDCDLKNYDSEIELFLDWISEYIEKFCYKKLLGYMIYEEDTYPTLIFCENKKIIFESTNKGE